MITIHKYTLNDRGEIHLSSEHKFLSVQMQNGKATFWFRVDTSSYECCKTYYIYGTGWEINEYDTWNETHVGTVQDTNGFVWHIFEKQLDV